MAMTTTHWLRFAPLLIYALLLLAQGTDSLPVGAVGCEGGNAAVGGKHLFGTVTTGELTADSIEFQIDDIPLTTSSVRTLTAGQTYTWNLITGGSPYRGFLVRLDGGDAGVDTTSALTTINPATAQVATTACVNPYSVGAITHSSNALKVSQSGTLVVEEASNGMRLDVTVVIANRDGISTYYYSGFAINVIPAENPLMNTNAATTITTTAPSLAPVVTTTAPTAAPKLLSLRFPTCSPTRPCGECIGDCDSDLDCAGDLECFQRPNNDLSPVPGCGDLGIAGRDYCYKATPNSLRPRLPECSSAVPCNACQGDCDSDAECAGNLRCFRREMNDFTPVYGCDGLGIGGLDYCYDPLVAMVTGNSTTNSTLGGRDSPYIGGGSSSTTTTATTYDYGNKLTLRQQKCKDDEQCGMCVGECQESSDCAGDLLCFIRSPGSMNSIPWCSGQPIQGVSYCTRETVGVLTLKSDRCTPQSPCEKCQGQCKVDADCQGNLSCFLRNDYTTIFGCDGMGDFGRSYCWDPNDFFVSRRHLRASSTEAVAGDQ